MRQRRMIVLLGIGVLALAGGAVGPFPAASGVAPQVEAGCATSIPGLGASTAAKIPADSTQAIVTVGAARYSSYNSISFWTKSDSCWTLDRVTPGRNGYAGWHHRSWDGSGFSPIGVYTLTDAGGRLPNPGTALPYFYRAKWYARGGFKMNNKRIQVFNYLVAVNFNRYPGRSPLDLARPDPTIRNGGIWFHVAGAGATRGCVSLPQRKMVWALRWLRPSARPVMVMGPTESLAS